MKVTRYIIPLAGLTVATAIGLGFKMNNIHAQTALTSQKDEASIDTPSSTPLDGASGSSEIQEPTPTATPDPTATPEPSSEPTPTATPTPTPTLTLGSPFANRGTPTPTPAYPSTRQASDDTVTYPTGSRNTTVSISNY